MRDNGKKILFAPARSQGSVLLSDPSEFIGIALTGDIERVRECLSVCPDMVNQKEKDHGNVALHVASSKGNLSMASLLLSKGANLNIQDIFGNSPLHYAVDKRRKEMAEMLIKCGADVNLKDFRGNTPLHIACANSDIDMVRLLLLHNADPELSDLSDAKPAQKTTSAPIRTLIERKLKMNHGGEEDAASKIVTMMSFGIGLGVGLGMAMAKQQQMYSEQQLRHQMALAQRKKRFIHGDLGAAYSGSQSLSGEPSGVLGSPGSPQLQNAGALVLRPGSGTFDMQQASQPQRRLL